MFARPEANPEQTSTERRAMPRFDMRLAAVVRLPELPGDELLTETQNVSARGVFFYLDRTLNEGSAVQLTVTFPPHITLTDPVRVKFSARVVRAETYQAAARVGIAALIEDYEFLKSTPIAEFFGGIR